jgi:hypothetical protein
MTRRPVLAAMAAGLAMLAAPVLAEDVTASSSTAPGDGISARLGGLMVVETASLSSLSEIRLRRLAAPYEGQQEADPRILSHDELDRMGNARGGAEWRCLTEALYFEARGEPIEGQYAVAEVILNRVDSARYPDTVCEVVSEGTGRRFACQFTYTCDGRPEEVSDTQAWNRLGHIARIMLEGAPRDLTAEATHYHAETVNPRWARVYPRTAEYGVHVFYRQQY